MPGSGKKRFNGKFDGSWMWQDILSIFVTNYTISLLHNLSGGHVVNISAGIKQLQVS